MRRVENGGGSRGGHPDKKAQKCYLRGQELWLRGTNLTARQGKGTGHHHNKRGGHDEPIPTRNHKLLPQNEVAQCERSDGFSDRRIDLLTPEGVADAIRVDNAEIVPAARARAELDFFYQQLLEFQPGLIGGKLPDKDFYHGA